jgi:hypothetical protein
MKPIVMGLLVVGVAALVALPAQAQNNFPFSLNFTWGFNPATAFSCLPTDMPDASVSCAALTTHRAAPTIPFSNASVLWLVIGGVNRNASYTGIGGTRFGISWDASTGLGAGSALWNLCTGGLQVPSAGWPNGSVPGAYNSITWPGGCYNPANADGVTKIGFLTWLSASTGGGQFRMDPDPTASGGAAGAATAVPCPPVTEVRICQQLLGRASIGGTNMSLNTCSFICSTPTSETTWSSIKNVYR